MNTPQLFMVLLGCKPLGRHTEQHDIFFGIARNLKELIPAMRSFWPEAKGKIHIDAYRIVKQVEGFDVTVVAKQPSIADKSHQLFFLNLGGYQTDVFEELHYKMLLVDSEKDEAVKRSKKSAFFKQHITPHIDDKYGVDVDDIFNIEEVLPTAMKDKYQLCFTPNENVVEDDLILGYIPINKL